MMHITRLELQNFKRFDQADIDFKRMITVLVGPNSSGKSSLIKAILALKQTASTTNENETLATQGEYVDLGVYKDYVHGHRVENRIEISTTISTKAPPLQHFLKLRNLRISITFGRDATTEQARLLEISASDPDTNEEIIKISKKATRETFSVSMSENVANQIANMTIRPEEKQKINSVLRAWIKGISAKIDDRYIITPERTRNQDSEALFEKEYILYFARNIINTFLRGLDNDFFYLGPLRRSPSRSYARTGHLLSVGPAGEHTPSVLANLKARAAKERSAHQVQRKRLAQFHDWMEKLFPGHTIEAKTVDELVKLVVTRTGSQGDTISDVGFGISQILPILVQISVMPDQSTLLIEQPELHLHPSVQTRLANVLAEASRSGRRFIIETHSEHIVRGLQLAISDERVKRKSRATESAQFISFLYIPEGPKAPFPLEVNEWGEFVKEWPSGFFDEAYRLSMRLLENKIKNMQPERTGGAKLGGQ